MRVIFLHYFNTQITHIVYYDKCPSFLLTIWPFGEKFDEKSVNQLVNVRKWSDCVGGCETCESSESWDTGCHTTLHPPHKQLDILQLSNSLQFYFSDLDIFFLLRIGSYYSDNKKTTILKINLQICTNNLIIFL